jgi:hypothetical protein
MFQPVLTIIVLQCLNNQMPNWVAWQCITLWLGSQILLLLFSIG